MTCLQTQIVTKRKLACQLERRLTIRDNLLVTSDSDFVVSNSRLPIGHTLRTLIRLTAEDIGLKVVRFHGVVRTGLQMARLIKARGGDSEFTLYLENDKYLDCYETVKTGQCIASRSNNSLHLTHAFNLNVAAVANMRLVLDQEQRDF